jgi:hypothetical protein
MSNAIYDLARYQLATAQLNWLTIPLVLSAWQGVPAFNSGVTTLSQITASGKVESGYSLAIAGQQVFPSGTMQTDKVLIPTVPIGPPVTWFTLSRKHATTHSLSQPILFIDDAEGLPFTPNGLDVLIEPDWLLERGWAKA